MKKFIICLTILAALNAAALADVLLGSWENAPDGWIDWGNKESVDSATNMPSKYQYDTIGATEGSQSLHMIKSGWNQNLAIGLNYNQRVQFMAHNKFKIDITVPADVVGGEDGTDGYAQIYNFTINAEGYGWHDQFTSVPLNFYFWEGSGQRTATLEVDYSAIKSSMPAIPGYVELVFATNSSSNRGNFYFDNARLTDPIPEPATIALLGLGLTLLRKRS